MPSRNGHGEDKRRGPLSCPMSRLSASLFPSLGDDGEAVSETTALLAQGKPRSTWRSCLWDTLDKSPEERRFLFKLDAVILTFASLGYFIKYLDQVNINSAFVSGMKEELNLYGNQLNYMQACWTVGYVIGGIPSNLLLTRIRPSIWIPACEVVWSTLTILTAKCTNERQIYLLRFFIGLAESGFYPGMQYIIGSWYRRDELGRRSCIFHASSAFGSMCSGYLMAAVHHLGGRYGFSGWQWLFIVDTIISLPVAVAGFFLLPDVPEITTAWYLSADEVSLAQRRMRLEGRAERRPLTRARVRNVFSSWHIYALTALYVFFNNGSGSSQPAFQIWLKEKGYPITAINTYPTITSGVAILMTLVYAWASDTVLRGARWPPIVFAGAVNVMVYSSLTAWDAIPDRWKWACFVLAGCSSGISGLTFAWAHEICAEDNEERALATASMNEIAYVFQAWLPLVIWKQVEAPRYPKGYPTLVGMGIGLIGMALLIRYLHRRELARKRTTAGFSVREEHCIEA